MDSDAVTTFDGARARVPVLPVAALALLASPPGANAALSTSVVSASVSARRPR